jgi:hypothetical protein
MKELNTRLYTKDSKNLQMPYKEYLTLLESAKENQKLLQVTANIVADLQKFLTGSPVHPQAPEQMTEVVSQEFKKDIIESSADVPEPTIEIQKEDPPEPATEKIPVRITGFVADVPPIKKDIAEHFNKMDASGRLFNIFKQYYTCMNDACGGTVRVTIKDGICSLWNYDEWEEFAFIDVFDSHLRIALDSRYTDELKSLNLCEVPRLLASRRNLICVQLDDLNNTALEVLAKAFAEVSSVKQ